MSDYINRLKNRQSNYTHNFKEENGLFINKSFSTSASRKTLNNDSSLPNYNQSK